MLSAARDAPATVQFARKAGQGMSPLPLCLGVLALLSKLANQSPPDLGLHSQTLDWPPSRDVALLPTHDELQSCPCSSIVSSTAAWGRCVGQGNLSHRWRAANAAAARVRRRQHAHSQQQPPAGLALLQVPEETPCPSGSEANFTAADCPNGSCYAGEPNGCGSRSVRVIAAEIVPERWPAGVDFTEACNTHDTCYFTLGSDKAQCDQAFLDALLAECDRAVR
jgi:hypothetical protein